MPQESTEQDVSKDGEEQANGAEPSSGQHNFDKGLQRIQQRQAATERHLQQLGETLNTIAQEVKNKGQEGGANSNKTARCSRDRRI